MKVALVGNPNCGKTTLFNALTKSNLHVGNHPGVTVDSHSAIIKNTDKTSRYTIVVEAESSAELRNVLDEIPSQIDIQVKNGPQIQSIIWK